MPRPLSTRSLITVPFEGDVPALLAALPAAAGVGQFLGPDGRNLVIGRPATLRRWAATHLGAGKPPRKGARPPTDLRTVTSAVAFATTTSAFGQRLAFERLMASYVPLSKRRDLKPPAYLHLDPEERFPRLTVRPGGGSHLYGPFRDRRAAARAVDALHKLFPLRPCDFNFEPAPELALGLSCLYAQVRSCAAPCLVRVSEDDYRGLAVRAASFLARPAERPEETKAWVPTWVAEVEKARGLVVEKTEAGIELYPVVRGAVLEERAVVVDPGESPKLDWTAPPATRDDSAWLTAWLFTPRRRGEFVVLQAAQDGVVPLDHPS